MSASLEVVEPGPFTTVQDLGRPGWQRYGVPVAGTLDREALVLANHLVGNPKDTAALEVLVGGLTLRVAEGAVRIAFAGDEAVLTITGPDGLRRVPAWRSARIETGEILKVAALARTSCALLALEGGLDLPALHGSLSTYVRGGLGGLEGRALRRGDRLGLCLAEAPTRDELGLRAPPDPGRQRPVRVVLGPQADLFHDESIRTLLESGYEISRNADRMGMRLEGPRLEHRDGFDIVSDGIAPGSIQVPGSGQPIVLLADRQTAGGYPKIATVISADVPLLGRRRPGDAVRFEAVTVAAAVEARRRQERTLESLAKGIRRISESGEVRLDRLYSENLVSGVVYDEL
jgi:biotin-dependent carboxylase-like uncharacterized protein